MFTRIPYRVLRASKPSKDVTNLLTRDLLPCCLVLKTLSRYNSDSKSDKTNSSGLVKLTPKEIFEKEFPDHYYEGKFISRMSYVEFLEQAMEKMKELGITKDINAYKELLKIFPPGKYAKKSNWDIGLFSAPQQIVVVRLLTMMQLNQVKPDKDIEKLVIQAFSIHSDVWLKVARMNYWSMKFRGMDPDLTLLENLPKQTHQLAKLALTRLLNDKRSVIAVTNTSSVEAVEDKTWVVYCQSPTQRAIIDRLDEKSVLYIENCGLVWVKNKPLNYFALRLPVDDETMKRYRAEPEPDFNYNTLKMQFYGRPIREKLKQIEDEHLVDGGYVLSLAITGTSSHDSVLSWLKILQRRNPKLKNINVVFKMSRPILDELEPVKKQDSS